MIIRAILPKHAQRPDLPNVVEGRFTAAKIAELNALNYNIYYLPNYPKEYKPGITVSGSHIDTFEYVFVDMDLKEGKYASKEEFLAKVVEFVLEPSRIVDSGNGVHVYWKISDLDAMSYLRLQRRLLRHFGTDEAVGQIYQLLRLPGTYNTKDPFNPKLCEEILSTQNLYSCEEIDAALSPITPEDEAYCIQHYNKTYHIAEPTKVDDRLPHKFAELLRSNNEVRDIWQGNTGDRSKADYRLGHVMLAHSFTRSEALSVLVNSAKALERAPIHRVSYAESIVDKIWTAAPAVDPEDLSQTVTQILSKSSDNLKGVRFPCDRLLDATHHGFRLGQVIGLVAGSGVGKTAMALNMFRWFVKNNPTHEHFFVPLEQPTNEIADRWRTMCAEETHLHDKVHVISNYREDGSFRHLSFKEIEDYIVNFQTKTGKKVGCVVIDHIGALKKQGKDGENQDLMTICHEMKAFAIRTNTLLVMQSQSSREKAGIGDLELSKDAAYGTVYFESYCDYLITIWQPLKRCYSEEGCPSVTAYKFCKIRHKKKHLDEIQEDVPYRMFYDPATERMRALTQAEEKSFDFFNKKATNARKRDRKTDILEYTSTKWVKEEVIDDGTTQDHKDAS